MFRFNVTRLSTTTTTTNAAASAALLGRRTLAHHAPAGTSFEPPFIHNRMALNPTVEKMSKASVKPTVHTVASRKHWKRKVGKGPLLKNFMDAKHTTLSEQAAIAEAHRYVCSFVVFFCCFLFVNCRFVFLICFLKHLVCVAVLCLVCLSLYMCNICSCWMLLSTHSLLILFSFSSLLSLSSSSSFFLFYTHKQLS